MTNDFQITVTTQPAMTQMGKLALARLLVAHIKHGLNTGTWMLASDGKAVPAAMLHFYEDNGIMKPEEVLDERQNNSFLDLARLR